MWHVPCGREISYYRFDKTLQFIYQEMINNSRGHSADIMRDMLSAGNPCEDYFPPVSLPGLVGGYWGAYVLFMYKVMPDHEWDHKWQLRTLVDLRRGNWADEYYPVRGDDNYEYFYDIWSNIHYGYVGSSIGFDRTTLQYFANIAGYVPPKIKPIAERFFGEYDPGDVISVDIGVELWDKHQFTMSIQDFHNALLQKGKKYFNSQDINGNNTIDIAEIHPAIGKLLPRGQNMNGELIGDWK